MVSPRPLVVLALNSATPSNCASAVAAAAKKAIVAVRAIFMRSSWSPRPEPAPGDLSRFSLPGEQVAEETVSPGHAGGQLPEEGEPGIDVAPLPDAGRQQRAALLGLARVVHGQERREDRVPAMGEIESA